MGEKHHIKEKKKPKQDKPKPIKSSEPIIAPPSANKGKAPANNDK